ncbi:hypothetical protein B1B_13517, partial [mine drainage metagenome]
QLFECDPLEFILSAAEALSRSRRARKERKAAIRQFRAQALREVITQLSLPFGQREEQATVITKRGMTPLIEMAIAWKDDEIVNLADAMITEGLLSLKNDRSKEVRKDILGWFAPSAVDSAPFSFAFCCRVAGFQPEAIRHFIAKQYRDEIKRYVEDDRREHVLTGVQPALI